jgi:hypothetical protein
MAGTILKQLSSTAQTDGTTVTPANSGLSSITIGTDNTAVFLAAAAMNEPAGYRFTQGSSGNQLTSYFDLTSPVAILALRVPLRISATPSNTLTFLRGYSDTAHTTNLWSIGITTTMRVNFTETAGSTTSTGSSAAEKLVAGTDYVMQILVDTTAQTFSLATYPRGSTTAINSISGSLTGGMPSQQSVRLGINTNSALVSGYIDTSSAFAIGSGDLLDRTDVSNAPPTLSLQTDKTILFPGETATITASASDSDGTITNIGWSASSGTLVGSGNTRTITAPAGLNDTTVTITVIATDDDGATDTKYAVLTFKASMNKLYTSSGWKPVIPSTKQ